MPESDIYYLAFSAHPGFNGGAPTLLLVGKGGESQEEVRRRTLDTIVGWERATSTTPERDIAHWQESLHVIPARAPMTDDHILAVERWCDGALTREESLDRAEVWQHVTGAQPGVMDLLRTATHAIVV